ncbi:MAG: hypothetical protein Q7R30_17715 [Acidobacteriota bacterium]|nr:hypothetical protein [Acidobacteriota bacterium]
MVDHARAQLDNELPQRQDLQAFAARYATDNAQLELESAWTALESSAEVVSRIPAR